MSYITNMVIYTDADDEAMARLNKWCAEHDHRDQQFERLDMDAAGGTKLFTSQVWAMAGNYFAAEGLAEAFSSFGWRYPESAVLIVDGQDMDACQVVRAWTPAPLLLTHEDLARQAQANAIEAYYAEHPELRDVRCVFTFESNISGTKVIGHQVHPRRLDEL